MIGGEDVEQGGCEAEQEKRTSEARHEDQQRKALMSEAIDDPLRDEDEEDQ